MTVAKLRTTVFGWPFQEYIATNAAGPGMGRRGILACAREAARCNVLTFQEHADEVLVGHDMMENAGDEGGPPIMAPVALVTKHNF